MNYQVLIDLYLRECARKKKKPNKKDIKPVKPTDFSDVRKNCDASAGRFDWRDHGVVGGAVLVC